MEEIKIGIVRTKQPSIVVVRWNKWRSKFIKVGTGQSANNVHDMDAVRGPKSCGPLNLCRFHLLLF